MLHALAIALGVAVSLPGSGAPNVLFIISDDQRRDTIAALGNPYIETPTLDRLVAEGTVFENCYVQGSMIGAVCRPSREMLLTGRTLFRIDPCVPLLPEVFRQAGYETFATGKLHAARGYVNRMFERGEKLFFGGMGSHTGLRVWGYDPLGRYAREAARPIGAFSSTAFANAAINFLRQRDRSRPFFLYLAFTAPHDPRTPPPEYAAKYSPEGMPLPPNFRSLHPFDTGWMTGRDERLAPWPRTPEIIRQHLADYYGMITHMDHEIGRVLEELERQGVYDRTIIVFTSDNGLAIGSHGLMGKQNLYEHSTGVPLIFAGPRVPRGQRRDALVYLFDIYPTLCHLAGLSVPDTVEGRSLVPVLQDPRKEVRATLFTAFQVQRAVRDHRWKLIRYTHINKTQLFDLSRDPYELRDLSGRKEFQPVAKQLMKELERWQQRLGDSLPLSSDNPRDPTFQPPAS